METKQKERIRRLMELLKKTDRIHLKDAARMLEVSVMTIRRDLSQENDEPLPLTLLGGYVVMVNKPSSPSVTPALATKPAHHRDDLPIAILAAGLRPLLLLTWCGLLLRCCAGRTALLHALNNPHQYLLWPALTLKRLGS